MFLLKNIIHYKNSWYDWKENKFYAFFCATQIENVTRTKINETYFFFHRVWGFFATPEFLQIMSNVCLLHS